MAWNPQAARRTAKLRQDKARPIIDGLHSWMLGQRQKVPEGSAIDALFQLSMAASNLVRLPKLLAAGTAA